MAFLITRDLITRKDEEGDGFPVTFGEGIYIAHTISAHRWNGWVQPFFTREVVDQLAADLANQDEQDLDEHRMLVRWDEERQRYILQSAELEADGDAPEIVCGHDIDGLTLYPIGAGSWTWYVAEEDAK